MNIVDLLISSAKRLPSKPAILHKEVSITYAELKEKVLSLANGLSKKGFHENTNIALMMQNGPEYIISYYAILSIGATVVPINPFFKASEVSYILENSEATGILTDELGIRTVLAVRKQIKALKYVVGNTNENIEGVLSWQSLCLVDEDYIPLQRHPDDTAHIIYTSGTTGSPKGVMITHANLNWLSISEGSILHVSPKDRVLCTLPLYHVYGNLQCMLTPFVQGATVYILEQFNANETLMAIAKEKITMYFGVPTMYNMFVQSSIIRDLDFSHLRICGSGGASIAVETIRKIKEVMKVDIL